MKTVKQIIEKHYKLDTDEEGNAVMYLGQIEDLLLEYGKQLLIEASERAKLEVDDYFKITESEKVSNEDCCVTISKHSILNIINELK